MGASRGEREERVHSAVGLRGVIFILATVYLQALDIDIDDDNTLL